MSNENRLAHVSKKGDLYLVPSIERQALLGESGLEN